MLITEKAEIKAYFQDIVDKNIYDKFFILTDENTERLCLPILLKGIPIYSYELITIKSGEKHKTIETVITLWDFLSHHKASRTSCLINLGGGLVNDLGGFAASTFKRGIDYINIPTTLLAMVDASTGGKTGINFNGLKNEIGNFNLPRKVLLDIDYIKLLDTKNFFSGYAEMVKHALIDGKDTWKEVMSFNLDEIDYDKLKAIIINSIQIKDKIVEQDPKEKGIRKALNLGHTLGHAFESYSYKADKPLPHGYAVIRGLLGELYLSRIKFDFPKEYIYNLSVFIKEYYGDFPFGCKEYDALYELMKHDKKNDFNRINFTLLKDIGSVEINQTATKEEIYECLDYLREG